jgi:hypothetical protein
LKTFLYLIQGRANNVINYTFLNNTESDVIVLTFDNELTQNNFPSIINIFLPTHFYTLKQNQK